MSEHEGKRRAAASRSPWIARILIALGITIIVIALIPLTALTFSVQVSGNSMEPTLNNRDRLWINIFSSDQAPDRFDVVEAVAQPSGLTLVKRVIGLPGDEVMIERNGSDVRVLIQPGGQGEWLLVQNEAWDVSESSVTASACCTANGTSSGAGNAVTVPDGSYWLLGDNFHASDDSRSLGWFDRDDVGRVLDFRILPLNAFGRLENPARLVDLTNPVVE